jgi:hypothetical protein
MRRYFLGLAYALLSFNTPPSICKGHSWSRGKRLSFAVEEENGQPVF